MPTSHRRGEYGLDGNIVGVIGMTALAALLVPVAIVLAGSGHTRWAASAAAVAALFVTTLVISTHTTRRGKFAVWGEILDALQLRGTERVLDVGCGRGAVLTGVARRLPSGRVVGLDIWSPADQSGNSVTAAQRNIDAEGVRERCALMMGDLRSMPLPSASFDLVVSSLAIHNVVERAGRSRGLAEIVRVLKPGGRLAIADLAWTPTYARELEALGLVDVRRRSLGWRFWWGPGFPSTTLVTATKPAAAR